MGDCLGRRLELAPLAVSMSFESAESAELRGAVGRVQCVQHGELRASAKRDWIGGDRLWQITDSVGGPRVTQLGARLKF